MKRLPGPYATTKKAAPAVAVFDGWEFLLMLSRDFCIRSCALRRSFSTTGRCDGRTFPKGPLRSNGNCAPVRGPQPSKTTTAGAAFLVVVQGWASLPTFAKKAKVGHSPDRQGHARDDSGLWVDFGQDKLVPTDIDWPVQAQTDHLIHRPRNSIFPPRGYICVVIARRQAARLQLLVN